VSASVAVIKIDDGCSSETQRHVEHRVNTAMFSILNTVVLHPLQFPNADRVAWAWGNFGSGLQAVHSSAVSVPDFQDYRLQNRSFQYFSAFYSDDPQDLSIAGHGEQVRGAMVSSDFFETLGVKSLLGRTFSLADEQVKFPESILSYGLWQREFGADSNVLGRTVGLNGGIQP
jgi:putative ABC transport system permease protein